MKVNYTSIFSILLVLLSGIPLISGSGVIDNEDVYARHATNAITQTQTNANECEDGTNCAISSPQAQGDGSASSPTNLQISETNDEAPLPTTTSPTAPIVIPIIIRTQIHCPESIILHGNCILGPGRIDYEIIPEDPTIF